ncbi:MAG TPA: proton-conducting transporter membrane subunit [Solirubrobacteraceae bacterium]|nr:proton-conducting transporter membrane subunit [Solirubrobacteraceae bacterium]
MSALAILMIVGSGGLALAVGLALVHANSAWRIGAVVAVGGSVALAAAGFVAVFSEQLVWRPFHWFGLGRGGVHVDQLAGLFLILTGVVSALLFVATWTEGPRAARVLRPLLVLCVVGVIVVDNVFEFLIVFELTVVAIYALISVRYQDPLARRAAELTLTLAKLGGGAVLAGLVLLGVQAGSFSFEQLAHVGPHLSPAVRGVCFGLLFAGFAVKAALIPLQTWLPGAYGGADADSSGFVAAVSLNVAFYAMLRMWFGFLGHPAVWWAVLALLVGALTALIGILGGILQRELRLFVAYSSIENSGLIVTDLGLALMGKAQHRPGLIGVGLIAAAFQITAHSVAKAGLFASVAAVEHSTGTSDMERLGGLYRRLPAAAIATLAGGAALAALPPFSGFVSEWLGLEALMQGFRVGGTGSHLAIALAGALVALTAGLAALAFVRATGMTFLGMPRDHSIEPAPESHPARWGMGLLALASLAIGIAAPWVVKVLEHGLLPVGGATAIGHISQLGWLVEPGYPHFASISPTVLALTLTGFALGAACIRRLASLRRAKRVPVWASGVTVTGRRAQYTAIGYANMVRVIFNVVYRVRTQLRTIGDQRFPERLSMMRAEPRLFDPGWLYRPITSAFTKAAELARNIQAGPLGLYLLYLLLAFIALLLVAPRLG